MSRPDGQPSVNCGVHPTPEQRHVAKLLAMIVRNAMEDFHSEHLSDEQMKLLNPLIRNAICTGLHMVENRDEPGAAQFLKWNEMLIPDYWEEPELLGDYVDLLRAAHARSMNRTRRPPGGGKRTKAEKN